MHKFILALFCWLGLIPVLPARAQIAPTYDLSSLERGAVFEYETSEGYLIVYAQGQRGENYSFRITKQVESGGVILTETGVSASAALVWRRFAGTAIGTTRYEPHDCSFVIDTCVYEVFERRTLMATVRAVTEFTEEIWKRETITVFEDGQTRTTNQCGIYDKNSMVLALFSFSSDGTRYWQKIASGPFAATADSLLDQVAKVCLRQMIIS